MNARLDQGEKRQGKQLGYYCTLGIKIIKVWPRLIIRVARKRIDAKAVMKTDCLYVDKGMSKQ